MYIINEKSVQEAVNMDEAIQVIEKALIKYHHEEYKQPERTFSRIEDENNLLIMPCFVDDCVSLKVVTSYPSNGDLNSNIPVTQGTVLIHDIKTGTPLSLINGATMTAIKTGAVSGVAMKHFQSGATTVGLVGTGLQGIYQLLAAISTTNVDTIYLYNRTFEKIQPFIDEMRALTDKDINFVPVVDVRELIEKSIIIITATTSLTPVLPNENIYENKLIVAVGSYKENMRELPEKLFTGAEFFYIDSSDGKRECGDIMTPLANGWIKEENVVLLSEIVTSHKQKHGNTEPIIFKSVSMALFDAMIGNYIYKKATNNNLGVEVSF